MSVKHKVLKDFQLLTNDKKIIVLKAKTVLEDYKYVTKNDNVLVEKDIIDNNPDFFSPIDWKEELNTYLRQNKIPQPAVLTKKLVPFIEEMFVINVESKEVVREVIKEVVIESNSTKEIELENKISKNEILEKHLKSELESINQRELILIQKEKEVKEQSDILNKREIELKELQKKLEERQDVISEKESNYDGLISREKLSEKISDAISMIGNKGLPTGDITEAFMGIIDNL